MTHCLKTWPDYYNATVDNCAKNFEIRKNDRNFKVGDTLILQEWDPETQKYTGREIARYVSYLIQDVCGLPEDICVMAVHPSL